MLMLMELAKDLKIHVLFIHKAYNEKGFCTNYTNPLNVL